MKPNLSDFPSVGVDVNLLIGFSKAELIAYIKEYETWKRDFEASLPSKLDKLAETLALWLMNSLGFAVAPSSILVRKIIEDWNKKEILGEGESK